MPRQILINQHHMRQVATTKENSYLDFGIVVVHFKQERWLFQEELRDQRL